MVDETMSKDSTRLTELEMERTAGEDVDLLCLVLCENEELATEMREHVEERPDMELVVS